jgi:TolB protein
VTFKPFLFIGFGAFTFGVASGAAQTVAQIEVLPPTVVIAAGQRQGVLATAYDSRGQVVATVRFTWSSTNLAVARVEPDARDPAVATIVGVAPGVATIEARAGGQRGVVQVQVTAAGGAAPAAPGRPAGAVATQIKIEPNLVTLLPTEDYRLSVLFLQDDGSPAMPVPFNWISLSEQVATVGSDGTVVGISPGQSVIEARTASGLVARAVVQVVQAPIAFTEEILSLSPGQSDTVRVVVPSQNNRRVASRWFQWSSSNPAVVTVTPLGVATAVGPGEAEITAMGFGQMGRLKVRVHRQVEEITVSPPPSSGPVTVPVNGTVQFTARALASDGTEVPEAPLRWMVGDTSVASFDPATRTLRGKKMGTTQLRLRGPGQGLEASWRVEVVPGGVAVTPKRLGLSRNQQRRLSASLVDDRGSSLGPAANVTWSSLDPAIARVDEGGNVTGLRWGRTRIVASTPWGRSDTVEVFVQGELLVTSTRYRSADLFAFDRGSPTEFNRITWDSLHSEAEAVFSPDGSRIAFVSDRDGNVELYVMNADGSDLRRLTDTPAVEGSPSWTADGKQIVYASNATGNFQIWIINADGTDPKQLTQEPGSNFQPAVSPDGRTIAFTSDRDGNYDIYLMSIDGSNQRNFTRSQVVETTPVWFPDGGLAYIVQESTRGSISSRVMRANVATGEVVAISPQGLAVADMDVSGDGNVMAMVVTTFERGGSVLQRLYLLRLDSPGATPIEVPRASSTDRFSSPSFRR